MLQYVHHTLFLFLLLAALSAAGYVTMLVASNQSIAMQ
jgi:hypothetical protein